MCGIATCRIKGSGLRAGKSNPLFIPSLCLWKWAASFPAYIPSTVPWNHQTLKSALSSAVCFTTSSSFQYIQQRRTRQIRAGGRRSTVHYKPSNFFSLKTASGNNRQAEMQTSYHAPSSYQHILTYYASLLVLQLKVKFLLEKGFVWILTMLIATLLPKILLPWMTMYFL